MGVRLGRERGGKAALVYYYVCDNHMLHIAKFSASE